ncbi:lysophospholipid acyltransferase family protein [Streptomyces sp. NPDC054784]
MSRRRIGFWYRLGVVIAKPPLVLFFKRDWRGMEHIPADGGFLAVINHNSYLDPFSYAHFQYNSGRLPRFLAKAGLFESGFVGAMMRNTGQIPVYRDSADANGAFRAAVRAVRDGECVAFYPEGTLTRDPRLWPMEGKTGAARVALLTGAPVIPVAQWGAHRALPPYAGLTRLRLLPRRTLTVSAGPPVDLSAFHAPERDGVERDGEGRNGEVLSAEVLHAATDAIMDALTRQLADIRREAAPAERFGQRERGAAGEPGAPDTGTTPAGRARDTAPTRREQRNEPAAQADEQENA